MKFLGGLYVPNPIGKIPIGGAIAKFISSKKLYDMLDGKRIGIKNWIFSFGKGDPPEPIRFGIDQIKPLYQAITAPGIAVPVSLKARMNIFHIGYASPNPEKGLKGGWHIGLFSFPKVVLLDKGIAYLAAGPHFYFDRFYHPSIGEIPFLSLNALISASPQVLEWFKIRYGVDITPLIYGGMDLVVRFLESYSDIDDIDLFSGSRLVASWDPNSIEVVPSGPHIAPQENLFFTIHFENTAEANYPAENITVKLVMDENLDIDTVNFGSSSHSNVLTTVIDSETRTIIWRFAGISLPPNQNPPEGEGWVQFSVALKKDIPSGTVIKAKAEIQFDENPPIVTNEIELTVDSQHPTSQVVQLTSEQTRSTFEVQWQAQDDVSGINQTELWVNEERTNRRGQQREGDGRMVKIDDKVYTLVATRTANQDFKAQIRGKFGYTYRFFAVSRDNVGNIEPLPEQPQATTQVGRAPQITQGLRVVSVPVQSEDDDPKVVFNFPENKWAIWDPTANNGQGGYVIYPNDAAKFGEPEKIPGRAYWVRLNEATVPKVFGPLPDDTQPFAIQLKRGWNLIGNPWLVDLIWNLDAIQVQVGSETKPLKNAQGIVEPYAWRWDGNNYQLVFDQNLLPNVDNKIPAWEGAWVFAWQDCNLIVPPPEANKGRRTRLAGDKLEGWFAKLVAQVGEREGKGFFGIAPNTRLQISQPPSPPEGQSEETVQVLFLDKNGNTTLADVRTGLGQRQEWDVVVKWDTRQGTRGMEQRKEVTLTFDGIGYAPKDVSLWLVDKVTGKRIYMRTQSAYRFVPNEDETSRQFKVIAELGNERPLRIVGLKATPMRGQGVVIEFALTKPAQVSAEVLTLTGRRVAVLEVPRSSGSLVHRLIWRGVRDDGARVSMGVYLVRVQAVDEEGRQVQAVTTVRMRP